MMENKKNKSRKNIFQKNSSKLGSKGRRMRNSKKQNFDKLLCKTSLSFMCCSYSIYFIFYAWCVYSLLSNQFFVIPICLVTFFFFLLDSPEKYKKQTFSSSFWFPIHLILPTLPSFTFSRCSIFNPKTPHFSVHMFCDYVRVHFDENFPSFQYFSCIDHNFNIFTTL